MGIRGITSNNWVFDKRQLVFGLQPSSLSSDNMMLTRINEQLSFFEEQPEKIHSIILIGSAVFGHQGKGSDVDLVVVCKEESYEDISHALDKRMIPEKFKVQYTIYKPSHVERIFTIGSPFANSIRNGVILKDDGYLNSLLKRKDFPLKPTREYYLKAFKDVVGLRYYFPIIDIERQIKKDHGPEGICSKTGDCQGHAPGDILATGILRMLYITLPHRGYMPLSKADVLRFATEIYGKKMLNALNKSIELIRQDRWGVTIDEYRLLKPFAVKLFRECLKVVDVRKNEGVIKELKDSARAARLINTRRPEERRGWEIE